MILFLSFSLIVFGIIIFLILKNVIKHIQFFYEKIKYIHYGIFFMWMFSMIVIHEVIIDDISKCLFLSGIFSLPVVLSVTILICFRVYLTRNKKSNS
jgi:uncharacterized MnhB-related membrane protein